MGPRRETGGKGGAGVCRGRGGKGGVYFCALMSWIGGCDFDAEAREVGKGVRKVLRWFG